MLDQYSDCERVEPRVNFSLAYAMNAAFDIRMILGCNLFLDDEVFCMAYDYLYDLDMGVSVSDAKNLINEFWS